jgi:hypothetical protein
VPTLSESVDTTFEGVQEVANNTTIAFLEARVNGFQ